MREVAVGKKRIDPWIRSVGHPIYAWLNSSSDIKSCVNIECDDKLEKSRGKWDVLHRDSPINGTVEAPELMQDHVWSVLVGNVVSDEFRIAMREFAEKDVQYIPMHITSSGKPIERKYWYMRPLTHVDCIDYVATERTLSPTRSGGYFNIYVKSREIPSHADFYCVDNHPGRLYVSDRTRRALRRYKLRGVCLAPQECTDVKQGMIDRRDEYLKLLFEMSTHTKGMRITPELLAYRDRCKALAREIHASPDAPLALKVT